MERGFGDAGEGGGEWGKTDQPRRPRTFHTTDGLLFSFREMFVTFRSMPVIVVGADTDVGRAVMEVLLSGNGEIRAFVSDPEGGETLKAARAKVAIGDVSDASHIGGAALGAHSAVLVADAATDQRERAFAAGPEEVFAAWAEGLQDASVARAIWVGDGEPSPRVLSAVPETMMVSTGGRSPQEVATEVAELDDRPTWA